tara:strand:- start:153 stop:416 length:264 start_codon:yes stop_codon:yes gene_type:complete
MNISDLRNIIQEEVDLLQKDSKDWTIGDLVKLKEELNKDNVNKASFQKLLLESSDRPSGPQLIAMWNEGNGIEDVKNGLKTMFPEHF